VNQCGQCVNGRVLSVPSSTDCLYLDPDGCTVCEGSWCVPGLNGQRCRQGCGLCRDGLCDPEGTEECFEGCCYSGESCCSGQCCRPGEPCCNGTCCTSGRQCIDGECQCNTFAGDIPCGGTCCNTFLNETCCAGQCCQEGEQCANGECKKSKCGDWTPCGETCCAEDQQCCDGKRCKPKIEFGISIKCCNNGTGGSCRHNHVCCVDTIGAPFCCQGNEVCNGDFCKSA
jgi:hypothetical protein